MRYRFITLFFNKLLLFFPVAVGALGWVSFVHTPPPVLSEGVACILEGSLIGVGARDRVEVRYRKTDEKTWKRIAVIPAYGDTYRATIPPGDISPPGIEYFVVMIDARGEERLVYASPQSPRKIVVEAAGATRTPDISSDTAPQRPSDISHRPLTESPSVSKSAGPTRFSVRSYSVADEYFEHSLLDDLTVIAGPGERKVTRSAAVITVISAEEIRDIGAAVLSDVLKSIPGLETFRDVQGFHQVAVRGLKNDPEIMLLVNGRRLDSLYDGRKLFELPLNNVDRIEVLRGPGAALHGGGALLGIINVIYRNQAGLSLSGSADTLGVAGVHGITGLELGPGHLFVDGDFNFGQGYRAPIVNDAFDDNPGNIAGYTNDSRMLGNLGASYQLSPGDGLLDLSIRGIYQDRAALVGAFDTVGVGSGMNWSIVSGGLDFRNTYGGFDVQAGFDAGFEHAFRSFRLTRRNFESPEGYTITKGVIEETLHQCLDLSLKLIGRTELFSGNFFSIGLHGGWQSLVNWGYRINIDPDSGQPHDKPYPPSNISSFPAYDPGLAQRTIFSVYAMDEWILFERLELTIGFRGDFFSGGVGREDPAAPTGTRGNEFALTPRFAIVFEPLDGWIFKGMHATAFRVPTFEELTSRHVHGTYSRGRFEGNTSLNPVEVRTSEVVLEHGTVFSDRALRLRINGFINEFNGRIEEVDLTGNITPLFNMDGSVLVFGAEGEGRIVFSNRDWISGGMGWFRAMDQSAPSGRNLLTTVPQLRLIVRGRFGIGRHLDFQVGVVTGSERRNNSRSTLEAMRPFRIPSYILVDTTLQTRPIGEIVSLALTVNNVLDVPYLDDVPRPDRMTGLLPGPGLSARLTARLDW